MTGYYGIQSASLVASSRGESPAKGTVIHGFHAAALHNSQRTTPTLSELAAGVNKTLRNFSASFCGRDLNALLYAKTMAYRSTKSVSVSIAPDLHQCAMDLVELNKRSGNQPVTFSAMAEAGVSAAVLKALPRLKKAGVKIPDSIKK